MAGLGRKPYQGVGNIIRFNWHFYVLAIVVTDLLLCFRQWFPAYSSYAVLALLAVVWVTGISLLVSWYIYDLSQLYSLHWLDDLEVAPGASIANIHAGFDETSALLAVRYPSAQLAVYDFYDPQKHTEVSIRRARKAYPAYPGAIAIDTTTTTLPAGTYDVIFLIFAAHEIRDTAERVRFFSMLRQSLRSGGRVVLVEHLRDVPNFMAYSIGFFHFLPAKQWNATFEGAGLRPMHVKKMTPFVTICYLG